MTSNLRRFGVSRFGFALIAFALVAIANGAVALAQGPQQFDSRYERELWRELPIWTNLLHNPPSNRFAVGAETDIKESAFYPLLGGVNNYTALYTAEYGALNPGECTFSHFGDTSLLNHTGADTPLDRQCKINATAAEPPPAGALLMPVGIAVDTLKVDPVTMLPSTAANAVLQHRVYVVDQLNHRVQVYNFDGTTIPLGSDSLGRKYQMGTGHFGTGTYTSVPGLHWPTGTVGENLNRPYGVAVDANHRILVSDGGNGRIVVFDTNGKMAFNVDLQDYPTGVNPGLSDPIYPNQVVLSPGTAVVDPASSTPFNSNDRIIVTDWGRCYIYSLNAKFQMMADLPDQTPPPGARMHQSCVFPRVDGYNAAVGEISGVAGAVIDRTGRVYVGDPGQNAVQVYTKNLQFLGSIGKPPSAPTGNESEEVTDSWLDTPVGVTVDHRNRIGVTDGGHARVAFYSVTYDEAHAGTDGQGNSLAPPVGTFEFQLDTTVSVEDFTMGLAEQCDPATVNASNPLSPSCGSFPGKDSDDRYLLDPKGRYLATDPLNRRILRFELPELGIVNPLADAGEGSFDVAVPIQKLGNIADVVPTVTPVEPGVTIDEGPTPVEPLTIAPGQAISYTFRYTSPHAKTTFTITAVGQTNEGEVEADPKQAIARVSCAPTCEAEHTIYRDPPSSSPTVATPVFPPGEPYWYPEEVFVRITRKAGSTQFSRVGWAVDGALAGQGNQNIGEDALFTGQSGIVDGPNGPYFDIRVPVDGVTTITYWPLTDNGETGETTNVELWLDLSPPHANFALWPTPDAVVGNKPWYRNSVTASYTVNDGDGSGPINDTGSVVIGTIISGTGQPQLLEGRDIKVEFDVYDNVGHSEHVVSDGANIDRTPPVVTPPANITVVADSNGIARVPASFISGSASAFDALSGVRGGPSNVTGTGALTFNVNTTPSITWTFTAVDEVGNQSSATAKVTAAASAVGFTWPSPKIVTYGDNLQLTADVVPSDARGTIRFTLQDPVRGNRVTQSGALVNGTGSASIIKVLNNVGDYTLLIEYLPEAGSTVPYTSATARVRVMPAPLSVEVFEFQKKKFGASNPAAYLYSLPGFPLHPLDQKTGALVRLPGENVGGYDILLGSLATNDGRPCTPVCTTNYTFVYHGQPFVIEKAVIQIKADSVPKLFGTANPSFTATVTGDPVTTPIAYGFTTTATTFSNVGGYTITVAPTQAVSSNYTVTFVNGTLTIGKRDVFVTADSFTRLLGAALPTLTYTVAPATATTGLVNGNLITGGTLVLPTVSGLGTFAITNSPTNPLTAGTNYNVLVTPGTLNVVSILPGNNPPVANPDSASTSGVLPIDISVLSNDTDPNNDVLTITGVTAGVGGTPTISGTKVKFTPTPGFVGTATFTYDISDGKGGTARATVTVTVTGATCTTGTINLDATSGATSGTAGNTRTFTGAGVQVKATGWSRTKTTSSPTWAKAYLGAYGAAGLGVTDTTEGTGSDNKHKVDNVGDRFNYVLFEFDKSVTVSKAFLDYVVGDSDITVWIATKDNPFVNRLTLTEAIVSGFGTPIANTGSNADRWAAFNTAGVQGNVILIAADVTDTTPEDEFKIAKLELSCGATNAPPTVAASARSDEEGKTVSVQIAAADPNNDALTYTATGLPPGLSISATTGLITGSLSYTSAGTYNVTVTVKDAANASASATFVWTVVNKNRPPDAINDTLSTTKNTAKTMSVIANDTDPDGDAITLQSVTQPPSGKGTVTKYSNGTLKYTPAANFVGTTSFTYTISDGKGGTDTATVTVTVASHSNTDGCDRDHDHDGDRDHDDDEERDCDRDHTHTRDCDHEHSTDHNRDCDRQHSSTRSCNDNDGWYSWRWRS